jgi:hypothetical protein
MKIGKALLGAMHQESSKVYVDRGGVSTDVYVDSIDICRAVDLKGMM